MRSAPLPPRPPAGSPPAAAAPRRIPTPSPEPYPAPAPAPALAKPPPPQQNLAAEVSTEEGNDVYADPAPAWRMVGAWLVDGGLITSVLLLFLTAASSVVGIQHSNQGLGGIDSLVSAIHAWRPILLPGVALGVVLALVYSTLFGFLLQGRSPGRWLFGIRLVNAHGQPPSPAHAAIRAVLALFSFALFLCGFWMAVVSRKRQTLHDKLTSMYLVRL